MTRQKSAGNHRPEKISRVGQVKRHTQIKGIHQQNFVNDLKGYYPKQNKSIINSVVLTCRRARIQKLFRFSFIHHRVISHASGTCMVGKMEHVIEQTLAMVSTNWSSGV